MDLASNPVAPILRKGQVPVPPDSPQDGRVRLKQPKGQVLKRDKGFRLIGKCPYQNHPEGTVTGELYFRLRLQGVDARLEVGVPSDFHKSGVMRVDIGVFKNDCLTDVIECKRWGKKMGLNGRQASAYRDLTKRFGVRAHFVNQEALMEEVLGLLFPNSPPAEP